MIKEFCVYDAWGPFTIALLKPDAVKKKIVEDLKDDLMMKGIRVRGPHHGRNQGGRTSKSSSYYSWGF